VTQLAGPTGKLVALDEPEVRAATAGQDYGRAWEAWRRKALQRMQAEEKARD
jgi:hypothetical protein